MLAGLTRSRRPRPQGTARKAARSPALRALARTPLGPWLLVAVAVGLAVFGLYSFCEARWRDVRP
ncbi:MAG TPA: DUF1206 domain-containing protein [Streptosporangiaceae bacterium]|jgi:hypothetical protein